MSALRRLALVAPVASLALVAGSLAPAAHAAGPPEHVVINDSRTSDPAVDLAQVRLNASWYWDSEQSMVVKVPNGFKAGQVLTVFFDVNGDSQVDGRYDLKVKAPKKAGGKYLRKEQSFHRGGNWNGGGTAAKCGGSEDGPPVFADLIKGKTKSIDVVFDLWWCLGLPNPPGAASWRAAVRLGMGKKADMAPNGQTWSKPVAGWGPCDPSGGSCN